jgi:hypothetical protein
MVKRKFALVRVADGTVVNTCVWDGHTLWSDDLAEAEAIECPDHVSPQWSFLNGEWLAPPEQPEPLDEG